MATKRTASEAGAGNSGPPAKKNVSTFEPVNIGTVSTLEEMDIKVLQFQNKKLSERIELRRRNEEELKRRIEQLEQRQATDDAVLVIVNRYWNQLDEDVRVLLQRFDAENADESEKENESPALTSFLTLLSQWDKPEIEEKLQQRVQFSNRAIGKLLTAYDRILQRNSKMRQALKEKNDEDEETVVKDEPDLKKEEPEVKEEVVDGEKPADEIKTEVKAEDEVKVKQEPSEGKEEEKGEEKKDEEKQVKKEIKKEVKVSEVIMEELETLQKENKRLHDQVTELHHKNHQLTLENSEFMDKLTAAETETAELHNKVEDLEYNLDVTRTRIDKYDRHLADAMSKVRTYEEGTVTIQGGGEGVSRKKFEEIFTELEEQKELATNRMVELEKLQKDHQEALKEVEGLKMDLATLPKHVIQETTDYKVLASQYSVLYNESMQMKTQLDEARKQLQMVKQEHIRHIEQMECDEIDGQKKLRVEVIQLEDQLAQVSREYQMLRIEFEQTLTANEQTAPINHEMRNLITSLKNHREQLKGEIARYKRKLKEAQAEIVKLKAEQQSSEGTNDKKEEGATAGNNSSETSEGSSSNSSLGGTTNSSNEKAPSGNGSKPQEDVIIIRKDEEEEKEEKSKEQGKNDAEIIKDLKTQLKKSQDNQKELKLLLDMYKSVPKEARDKVQLMAAEKKAKQEIDELKAHIRKMQEAERKERRKLAEEDAIRKIKKLEETISELQKNLAAQKQEEEALLSEMEVTGQAFEDMQEQNTRLIQQLKEKDDANFKLMSERIKSNQIHKLLREEKEILAEQVLTIQRQVEAQNQVVRKLEEKERILQNNMNTIEKELSLRQSAAEMHKRKAVESAQTAADLKLHLDKYHSQLKDAQVTVGDKTSALQQETFKHKRLLEEIASLRRKVERAKKIEMATSADEVLMEEIREYKEQLTCPSCKVKKKDAVLTKCFHVFCLECLKTRYETRQRKCPKCNAAFGANDFHRLYLS